MQLTSSVTETVYCPTVGASILVNKYMHYMNINGLIKGGLVLTRVAGFLVRIQTVKIWNHSVFFLLTQSFIMCILRDPEIYRTAFILHYFPNWHIQGTVTFDCLISVTEKFFRVTDGSHSLLDVTVTRFSNVLRSHPSALSKNSTHL